MLETMTAPQKVLIVDDIPQNLEMLFEFLSRQGYQVLAAENGERALEIARDELPDLILLDVMMPGIDGFEACRRLKGDPLTAGLPVIFMTALTETEHKLQGFAAGGVDYITKPFSQQEVAARARTQISLYHLRRTLADRNAQLDLFAHAVAHDLKDPLNLVLNLARLVLRRNQAQLPPQDRDCLERLIRAASKSTDIVESLLMLAHTPPEGGFRDHVDMRYALERARHRLEQRIAESAASIEAPEVWPFAIGYPPWVEEIWVQYLDNALRHGGRPPRIELGFAPEGEEIRFWVRDNGAGLDDQARRQLFAPVNGGTSHTTTGAGVGLHIVTAVIDRLGGRVGVEPSASGTGSCFYFTLPAVKG
jgi:two-component system, sensor histidine kinase and response regulator